MESTSEIDAKMAQVKKKKELIKKLNEIDVPLNVTVYMDGQTWSVRNSAFWEKINTNDEKMVEFMEQYLMERS